jgi:hypothetical protein
VGEALQALARDIQTGKKSAETLIHIDPSGVLCLKWPDALSWLWSGQQGDSRRVVAPKLAGG